MALVSAVSFSGFRLWWVWCRGRPPSGAVCGWVLGWRPSTYPCGRILDPTPSRPGRKGGESTGADAVSRRLLNPASPIGAFLPGVCSCRFRFLVWSLVGLVLGSNPERQTPTRPIPQISKNALRRNHRDPPVGQVGDQKKINARGTL